MGNSNMGEKPMDDKKLCKCSCGEEFTPNRPWQEFISKAHQQAFNRARYREMEAQEQGDDQQQVAHG
jgi:hypothetical protein